VCLLRGTFCSHSVFMCFVWIWEQKAIISLYSSNWLVFITETEFVYCAVRAVCYKPGLSKATYIIYIVLKPKIMLSCKYSDSWNIWIWTTRKYHHTWHRTCKCRASLVVTNRQTDEVLVTRPTRGSTPRLNDWPSVVKRFWPPVPIRQVTQQLVELLRGFCSGMWIPSWWVVPAFVVWLLASS
jgi:hypothetical protein